MASFQYLADGHHVDDAGNLAAGDAGDAVSAGLQAYRGGRAVRPANVGDTATGGPPTPWPAVQVGRQRPAEPAIPPPAADSG